MMFFDGGLDELTTHGGIWEFDFARSGKVLGAGSMETRRTEGGEEDKREKERNGEEVSPGPAGVCFYRVDK
jgi:hypothetical protein